MNKNRNNLKKELAFKLCVAGYSFKIVLNDRDMFEIIKQRYEEFSTNTRENVTLDFHLEKSKKIYYIPRKDFEKKLIKLKVNSDMMKKIFNNQVYGFNNFLASIIYYWLFRKNIITLHASGVIRNGKAFIFPGPSETGKTTIAKLSAGKIMNDNEIIIKKIGKEYFAYASPFQRRDIKPKNIKASIKGIFFLKGKNKNKIIKLKNENAFNELIKNQYPHKMSYENKGDLKILLNWGNTISEKIPSYKISFKIGENIWRMLDEI
jgi:hypothetical protein